MVASYATHLANAASLKSGEAAFDAVEMPGFEPGSEKYLISRFAQDEKIFDTTWQGISSRLIPMDTHWLEMDYRVYSSSISIFRWLSIMIIERKKEMIR